MPYDVLSNLTNAQGSPTPMGTANPFNYDASSEANGLQRRGLLDNNDARWNNSQDSGFQNQLIQQLHQQAQGDPNSLEQKSLHSAFGAARNQASSMSTMRHGFGGPGAAMQDAQSQQGQLGQQEGAQSHLLLLQQQRAAQQQLMGALSSQRQADMGYANTLAQGTLQGQSQNNNAALGMQDVGLNASINQQHVNVGAADANANAAYTQQQAQDALAQQLSGAGAGLIGSAIRTYGGSSNAPDSQTAIDNAFNGSGPTTWGP